MSTPQKRKAAGAPASAGGQFDANDHAEAGQGLTVNHESLMDVGETREMPASNYIEIVGIHEDDDGITVVEVAPDPWGHPRTFDSDEHRVPVLAHLDGITGSAHRVESDDSPDFGGERYRYEITLTNPKTGETVEVPYFTGNADSHERTPGTGEVLQSLVSDADAYDRSDGDIEEFASEYGYEPDYDDDDAYDDDGNFDPWHKVRPVFEGCKDASEKVQRFLGDDYDLYRYGENADGESPVRFKG